MIHWHFLFPADVIFTNTQLLIHCFLCVVLLWVLVIFRVSRTVEVFNNLIRGIQQSHWWLSRGMQWPSVTCVVCDVWVWEEVVEVELLECYHVDRCGLGNGDWSCDQLLWTCGCCTWLLCSTNLLMVWVWCKKARVDWWSSFHEGKGLFC